jgi:hypothetical protein
MNTLFSRPRNDLYSDSYNQAWSNQSSISWKIGRRSKFSAPQALHWAKGEEVSIVAPSSSTLILKTPYEP